MKILIGTPLYNHQLDSRTVTTMLDILKEAQARNTSLDWDRPSSCLLSYNRNVIAHNALKHEFDWLLFMDADMQVFDHGSFPFQMIETAAKQDADIVGVPVRLKNQAEEKVWNFCFLVEQGYMNWKGNLPIDPMEVDVIGTGIMLIKTSIFKDIPPPWFQQTDTYHKEDFVVNHGDIKYPAGPGFFPEDFNFCEKAKRAGKKILMYPGVKAIHHGSYPYQ